MVLYVLPIYPLCYLSPALKCFETQRSPADHGLPQSNCTTRSLSRHSSPQKTLLFYKRMMESGISPDHYSFPSLFNACARSLSVKQGREIHGRAIKTECRRNPMVVGSLIHMYAKCGCIDDARRAFDEMLAKNIVIWSILIDGYVKNGHLREGVELFCLMLRENMVPNDVTAIAVLSACDLKVGRLVHGMMEKLGLSGAVALGTSLINMYFRCHDLVSAHRVFDCMPEQDHVAWNTMIAGLVLNGLFEGGIECFKKMVTLNLKPEPLGVVSVFKGCVALGDFQTAKKIHSLLDEKGTEMNMNVCTALVDMYMKFGKFEIACQIFDKMPKKDVVAWTTMISGFADHGCSKQALAYFDEMMKTHVDPNEVTLASVLSACAHSGILGRGIWIHQYIKKKNLGPSVILSNALMDMYAKCGHIEAAMQLFEGMTIKDISSWNVMINALARHGASWQALDLFEQMIKHGIRPNSITFVGVLSACCHGALVNSGRHYFDSMTLVYGIDPRLEHYACMVDLLGRSGLVQEAEGFIEKMPIRADAVVWGALLGACRIHGNVEIAERTAQKLIDLEPGTDGVHVLLSNIYASACRWEDAKKVRSLMKAQGIPKRPGGSWIEVNGVVHEFLASDNSHAQHEHIYNMLVSLAANMKFEGCSTTILSS